MQNLTLSTLKEPSSDRPARPRVRVGMTAVYEHRGIAVLRRLIAPFDGVNNTTATTTVDSPEDTDEQQPPICR